MGVESYLVADAVNLIIAQRLVRRICTACKQEVSNLPESVYDRLGITKDTKIYEGKGCKICDGSGYKGRVAIFEILTISKELRRLIAINAPENEMRALANKDGLVTLRMAAVNKLKAGITTVSEVLSVTSANK
jgi:type IV pilus assembly protein PilB